MLVYGCGLIWCVRDVFWINLVLLSLSFWVMVLWCDLIVDVVLFKMWVIFLVFLLVLMSLKILFWCGVKCWWVGCRIVFKLWCSVLNELCLLIRVWIDLCSLCEILKFFGFFVRIMSWIEGLCWIRCCFSLLLLLFGRCRFRMVKFIGIFLLMVIVCVYVVVFEIVEILEKVFMMVVSRFSKICWFLIMR